MSKVLVEVSARHVHLSQEDLELLFGAGHQLTPVKDLSQPGQYASAERVKVVGSKREIDRVIVLGPTRSNTQVEISLTDARSLGIEGVVRESGNIAGTPGCIIVGPVGEIEIKEGVIVAKRHIHITPEDANKFNVSNNEIIGIKLDTEARSLVFDDVVVRVSEKFSTAVHLDTDEANAAAFTKGEGSIIKFK
ncbi:MAG: phosphate propanoyltransferase [Erysipelotrichaceae bacterium]